MLFNMLSFGPKRQRKSVQPLIDCFVSQFLVDLFPTAQHFFQVIEILNLLSIDKLMQCSPNAIVDWIEVIIIIIIIMSTSDNRSGLFGGQFSGSMNSGTFAVRKATVCLDRCAGASSCWKMKWFPDSRRMSRSTPLPPSTYSHSSNFSTSFNKHQWCLAMFR